MDGGDQAAGIRQRNVRQVNVGEIHIGQIGVRNVHIGEGHVRQIRTALAVVGGGIVLIPARLESALTGQVDDPVHHVTQQLIQLLRRMGHRTAHAVQLGGNAVGAVLRVGAGLIHQRAKLLHLPVQLVEKALRQLHLYIGIHLPGNAAHILSAADGAAVDTQQDLTAAASHDAAGVVADMLVAYGGAVLTPGDNPPGIAGDAAGHGLAEHRAAGHRRADHTAAAIFTGDTADILAA